MLENESEEAHLASKEVLFLKKAKTVKGLWSYVQFERGSNKGDCGSLINEEHQLKDVTNLLNDHFCAVMNPPTVSQNPVILSDDQWSPSFSAADVWQLLKQLPSTGTGSDGFPTLLYKKAALILADPLHDLLTFCFRSRVFPEAWKIADVIPVPKSSGRSVEDYRPISLLPIPAKLAEKIILDNMRSRFISLLGDSQFGIRRNSSTTDAVITVHDVMTSHADRLDIGASIFIAFDYSKAFDKIDHQLLISQVVDMNLPRGFILLLMDYLRHRKQRVRVNGFKSDLKSVTSGVPQGSLLGPFLFGLYISSLKPCFPSTTMIKYMDDVSLIVPVRKSSVTSDLVKAHKEIDHLSFWSTSHVLTLNADKTIGLIYSRAGFDVCSIVKNHLYMVKFCNSVRFLGVVLESSLGWRAHVNLIEKKCSQRMYILRRISSVTSIDEFRLIYFGLIRTLIEYACPAFVCLSSREALRLERIQKRCLKIKKNVEAPDLSERRRSLAMSKFSKLSSHDTFLKTLFPTSLPSGRLSIPFCRTTLRRSSFFPYMSILSSCAHCD